MPIPTVLCMKAFYKGTRAGCNKTLIHLLKLD